jgi:hypothetical protein
MIMLKTELKEKWGYYCDTDKLVDDMMALLSKYNHRNTEFGVCAMLDEFFTNKKSLIDLFMTSDKYVGDFRIVIDVEIERTSSRDDVCYFCNDFPIRVDASKAILKYTDDNGKSLDDYTRTGFTKLHVRNLFDKEIRGRLESNHAASMNFSSDGSTKKSTEEYETFSYLVRNKFYINYQSTLQQDVVDAMQNFNINASFVTGMKTSRAFNRFCAYYGVDKLPEYNRLYAQYADMVSGLKRKLKFFISVNPLDYLTMSFGVNWASCHTIDKTNTRNMPSHYSGAYCGGTVSYMLDSTSFITYVHDKIPTDVEEGKIYRNMFHYGNDILVQGRIYPQGNDGLTDLYSEFRKFVQTELNKLLCLTNDVWVKRNRGCGANTATYGVHYADYLNFSQCNVTYPKERSGSYDNVIAIGHNRICPHCGLRIDGDVDASQLAHRDCVAINELGEVQFTDDDWFV